MEEFGDLSGIVFNIKTGNLIGGHQRVSQLDPKWKITKTKHKDNKGTVAVGHIETPNGDWVYREVEWNPKKETMANIAANQHGGEFDIPMLGTLLTELNIPEIGDMSDWLGFSHDDIIAITDFDFQPTVSEDQKPLTLQEPLRVTCPKCKHKFEINKDGSKA